MLSPGLLKQTFDKKKVADGKGKIAEEILTLHTNYIINGLRKNNFTD